MLKDVIKVSLLQKGQNDRIKNIISVYNGIQGSLTNFELNATIMTNSSPDHNTSTSYTHAQNVPHACGTHDNVHR
jgi:hypothetical protein